MRTAAHLPTFAPFGLGHLRRGLSGLGAVQYYTADGVHFYTQDQIAAMDNANGGGSTFMYYSPATPPAPAPVQYYQSSPTSAPVTAAQIAAIDQANANAGGGASTQSYYAPVPPPPPPPPSPAASIAAAQAAAQLAASQAAAANAAAAVAAAPVPAPAPAPTATKSTILPVPIAQQTSSQQAASTAAVQQSTAVAVQQATAAVVAAQNQLATASTPAQVSAAQTAVAAAVSHASDVATLANSVGVDTGDLVDSAQGALIGAGGGSLPASFGQGGSSNLWLWLLVAAGAYVVTKKK